MNSFILSPSASFHQTTIDRVDIGVWTVGAQSLILATNMNYASVTVRLTDINAKFTGVTLTQVLDSGGQVTSGGDAIVFESVGSAAFVVKKVS